MNPLPAIERALASQKALIGKPTGKSNWISVDQRMIDTFAEVTKDDQWIHVDAVRAAASPLGGTIAHGFLTLSLASRFYYDCMPEFEDEKMSVNYGFDKIRFLAPVRSGAQLRGSFSLKDARKKSADTLLLTHDLSVEIRGEESPALVAEWLNMVTF